MRNVLIVTDPLTEGNAPSGTLSGTSAKMVSALQQAILHDSDREKGDRLSPFSHESHLVQALDTATLNQKIATGEQVPAEVLLCPLTLNLPANLKFPGQAMFQQCRDVEALRQRVADWGYSTQSGNYWLPLVLTAKGPLYAEVIGREVGQPEATQYVQPIHLSDAQRQSLYELGFKLLRSLQAVPSVYLMQFGYEGQAIWFDRLLPFPAEPAIASFSVQEPDLFVCHWYCISGQPLREISISL